MLLAGDVGGTKTLLGLFAKAPHRPTPIAVESFHTVEYDGLVPMIREFLRRQPAGEPSVEAACFGVAGPVLDDVAELTNVSWTVDGKAVARRVRARSRPAAQRPGFHRPFSGGPSP